MKKLFFLFLTFILFLVSIGFASAACTQTTCDNIGQIQNNKYCSVDGVWCDQLSTGACENNFECQSGNCFEGTCSASTVKEEYEKQKSLLEQIWNMLAGQECDTIGKIYSNKYCDVNYKLQTLKYGGTTCALGYECLSGTCTSTKCTCSSTNDCNTGNVCSNNLCVAIECTTNSNCNSGYTCVNSLCILTSTTCASNSDCTQGVCDTSQSKCVECLNTNNCDSGEVCSSHNCVTPSPGSTTTSSRSSTVTAQWGNSYSFEKMFSHVKANKLYFFGIKESPIPVDKISFITNKDLTNVKFIVKRMTEKGSDIPEPKGLIYSYFHLKTENIQDDNLEKAEIDFRVAKSWLNQNKLKYYKVILQRYTTKWTEIKPQLMAENSEYYYYTSVTPGFSWFAITSAPEKPTVPYVPSAPSATQPECGDGIADTNEDCATCPEDIPCLGNEVCSLGVCVQKKKTSIFWFIIPLILVILIVIAVILYKKRKKTVSFIRPTTTIPRYTRR